MAEKGKDGYVSNSRTAQEVLYDHLRKRKDRQLEDDIALNYKEDVIVFTVSGILRGHEGVKEAIDLLEEQMPNPSFTYATILVDGDVAFLEWSAEAEHSRVRDGAETYVIRGGQIIAQTIHFTVEEFPED